VAWKAKLSHIGNGSPIVWGEHVFVTGADKKLGVIYCFKTDAGKQVWHREVPLTGPAKPMKETGYATPTPATDGKRVYSIFATGDVAVGRVPPGYQYTLPTEAQWEYARRASKSTLSPEWLHIGRVATLVTTWTLGCTAHLSRIRLFLRSTTINPRG